MSIKQSLAMKKDLIHATLGVFTGVYGCLHFYFPTVKWLLKINVLGPLMGLFEVIIIYCMFKSIICKEKNN